MAIVASNTAKGYIDNGSPGNSNTVAFPSDVTAGNVLLVCCAVYDPAAPSGNTITTPTDTSGNTYVAGGNAKAYSATAGTVEEIRFATGANDNRQHMQWYFCTAVSSGANTVTFGQTNTTGTYHVCFIMELSGTDSLFPVTGRSMGWDNTPTTSPATGSITTGAGCLTVAFISNDTSSGTATFTEQGGWSNVIKETDANTHLTAAVSYATMGADGTVNAAYTTASHNFGIYLISFLPSESNAGGYTPPVLSDSGVTDATYAPIGYPAIGPNALYDPVINKTLVPYLSGTLSNLSIAIFDHAARTWSRQTDIATGGVNDGHGEPAIVKGSDNKYHIFWGSHATAGPKYVRSTNANDPSAWSVQPDVDTSASYANAFRLSDNTLALVYRAGGHTSDWILAYSTNNGTSWTTTGNTILDSTAANVWYPDIAQVGDILHFMVTWEDEVDSLGNTNYPLYIRRYGLYYFNWNALTDAIVYSDGTTTTRPVGGLTKAILDAHCVIVAADSTVFDEQATIAIGTDGYPAFVAPRGYDINHVNYFRKWNGTSWSSHAVNVTGQDHTNNFGVLVSTGVNLWTFYAIRKGNSGVMGDWDPADYPADVAGGVDEYRSTDDGLTWARMGTILTPVTPSSGSTRWNNPARVKNGVAPAKYIVANWPDVGTANGKILAWTDSISVQQRNPLIVRQAVNRAATY